MPEKNKMLLSGREYIGVDKIDGPLVFVRKTHPVGYKELIECIDHHGNVKLGIVLESSTDVVVVQVFEGTSGLTLPNTRIRFSSKPLNISVSRQMLGRVFNGLGQPIDGGPPQRSDLELDINGIPINPTARQYPRDFIQTGLSAIDGMNALVRGQKLPLFSGNGLPHDRLAAQITRQAKLLAEEAEFKIIFCAMGGTFFSCTLKVFLRFNLPCL